MLDLSFAMPGPWIEQALCSQADPEIFFPNKGGTVRPAKSVCRRCPVRSDCLIDAIQHRDRFGIRGGFSERDRRRLEASPQLLEQVLELLTNPERLNPRHVRSWCAEEGINVSQFGRIPRVVQDAYRKAMAA